MNAVQSSENFSWSFVANSRQGYARIIFSRNRNAFNLLTSVLDIFTSLQKMQKLIKLNTAGKR